MTNSIIIGLLYSTYLLGVYLFRFLGLWENDRLLWELNCNNDRLATSYPYRSKQKKGRYNGGFFIGGRCDVCYGY